MKAKLQASLKEAQKARNQVRLDTIRSVLAAMQYEALEKKVDELPNDQALGVIQREIKKRKEEVEYATQAKREDLKEKLFVEIKTLEEFLPSQLSAQEIEKILTDLKAANATLNMGTAMKSLKDSHAGQYEGKLASEIAKRVFG